MECVKQTLGALATNTYIVRSQTTTLLIDPAAQASDLLSYLRGRGWGVDAILLTHGHFDHIGAVAECRRAFGCPIYMHAADVSKIEDMRYLPYGFGVPAPETFAVDCPIERDTNLRIGDIDVRVICTPGHSAGSVCYAIGESLFCGDTLFAGSYGRTDFADGDFSELCGSVHKLFAMEKDYVLHCGHGADTRISAERKYNPICREWK